MQYSIQLSALVLVGSFSTGCVSTNPMIHKTTSQEGQHVVGYSSQDTRSALTGAKKDRAFHRADSKLAQSLNKAPRDVKTWVNRAQIALMTGKLEEAESHCRQAIKLDLSNRTARKILAAIQVRRGQGSLARITLGRLTGLKSDSEALSLMAVSWYQEGNLPLASQLFQQAIAQDKGNIAARMNYGILLSSYRHSKKAAAQFEWVLKVIPEHVDANLQLAIVLDQMGQREAARDLYRKVLSIDGDNAIAHFNLSQVYRAEGEYDRAMNHFNRYLASGQITSAEAEQGLKIAEQMSREKASSEQKLTDDDITQLAASSEPAPPQKVKVEVQPAAEPAPTQGTIARADSVEPEASTPQSTESDEIEQLEKEIRE